MRTSTWGLESGTYIRIRHAASVRHSRGKFIEEKNGVVYYRSDYNGGVYPAPLENVSIDMKFNLRMKKQRAKR